MKKKIVIKESQFKLLTDKWKKDLLTAKQIAEDIDFLKRRINESKTLNESVIDTIKNYLKKGALTATVIASLLASNHVNAQQLAQAGVPKQNIERAIQINNSGGGENTEMSNEKIESIILKNLKRGGFEGTLKSYQGLRPEQKQKVFDFVRQQIKSGANEKDIIIKISNWVGKTGGNAVELDQKVTQGTKIKVDTVQAQMNLPVKKMFEFNSYKMNDPAGLKKLLQDSLNTFVKVDSIVINASSSTLRNKGEAEGLTWMELSELRANSIVELLDGMTYDLGGRGINPKQTITRDVIKIDVKGENGDGTSGPPSPYEVDPSMVKQYQDRGIDAKFWDSNSKGDPLASTEEYAQYQWVTVIVYGKMVENNTENIVNYRYVSLLVQQKNIGSLKKGHTVDQNIDVLACPVHGK